MAPRAVIGCFREAHTVTGIASSGRVVYGAETLRAVTYFA
jgi:hypothetical protein